MISASVKEIMVSGIVAVIPGSRIFQKESARSVMIFSLMAAGSFL